MKRVKNPTGRLDWLAATIIERFISQRGDPLLQRVYGEVKEQLESELTRQIGPRNKTAKQITRAVRMAARISSPRVERVA